MHNIENANKFKGNLHEYLILFIMHLGRSWHLRLHMASATHKH